MKTNQCIVFLFDIASAFACPDSCQIIVISHFRSTLNLRACLHLFIFRERSVNVAIERSRNVSQESSHFVTKKPRKTKNSDAENLSQTYDH